MRICGKFKREKANENLFGTFDYFITSTDSNGNESDGCESVYI